MALITRHALSAKFVPAGALLFERSLLLGAIRVGMGFVWLCTYAVFVSRFSVLLGKGPLHRCLQAVTGAALTGLGLQLAFERR